MSRPFLQLQPVGEQRWRLDIVPGLCVGRGDNRFLFGGAGLAAAVSAMESASARPAIWATAQYLSYARPGSVADLSVDLATTGKYITQARATLSCDGRTVLTATAALGDRSEAKNALSDQWARMPDVPPPEECAESPHWGSSDSMGQRIAFRAANGFFGDVPTDRRRDPTGKLDFWLRPHEADIAVDRILLALAADFVTPGIRNAMGRSAGGNSLDNTIRYGRLVPTDWLLCEVSIEAITDGVVHGSMLIFARTGELLASASQSMILRVRD